jgi:two-component system chemotaxis response regulator CheB
VDARPRVLIVDDSAVVRGLLARGLAAHGLEVVGVAADPFIARDLVLAHKPDVLTLDIEMPRMNGLTFLERLMAFHPVPVVVLSSLSSEGSGIALRALELGAVEVLAKPAHDLAIGSQGQSMAELAEVLRQAAQARVRRRWSPGLKLRLAGRKREGGAARRVLALGASTGGTQALPFVLAGLPPEGVGCVLVQHMPAQFTPGFAARLDELSPWKVRQALHGELLREGEALLAPGDRHLVLQRDPQGWRVRLADSPPVNHVRPSVDVLMESVARAAGPCALGALLTGMGRDGAAGLLAMRQAGARTLVQDEASCSVYGMPREAVRLGAAELQASLEDLGPLIGQQLLRLPLLANDALRPA